MKKFIKSNIKVNISVGFALAFLAFVVVQILSNKSIQNLNASFVQISEVRQLRIKVSTVFSAIQSYQNKITLFVLTGNEHFLNDNEVNLSVANSNLQDILESPMNAAQFDLVSQLDSLVKADVKFCQQALILYNKNNRDEAISLISKGRGEQLINEISETTQQLRQIDESNLAHIMNNNESFSRNVNHMDYAATLFAIVVIAFSIWVLFRDINKRINVENQLRLAQQKTEQSAIMKEQFMANMSHEIRTPMNAIIGFAGLLSKSDLDNSQKNHLKAIQASGENLLNIINDILDYSKIEAGMVNIEEIQFSLPELLHSINVMFLPKAIVKNIKFDLYTSIRLPDVVLGDPTRLTQILANLIGNALKFTSEGSISLKTELLREEHENVFVQFTVKDTGIGIPSEKFNEVFERFTQASADTNRKYGGSGLGLSIVKKLVELQGGHIHVESAEGVGSSFTFILPYKKSKAAIPLQGSQIVPMEMSDRIPKSQVKILVAEDNPLNQNLAELLLKQWGFDFDIVDNGIMAIDKLKKQHYDLILMDIQMPEMNGYDAARFIRQELHLDIPVVAMTAHVLPGEKEKCLSFGMTDYISKPIREIELYNMIAKYISNVSVKEKPKNTFKETKDDHDRVTSLEYIRELSNGNPAFISHMIELFLSENPNEIIHMEEAVQQKDFALIAKTAHKIKSTISFAGLDSKIRKELSEIENLASEGSNLPAIEILFTKVKLICLKAIDELNSLNANHT